MERTSDNLLPRRRKILVMRYRFIGDTLLTVPFLRNLRRAYPEAQIDMLVAPNSGEILRDCPYLDRLIFFDTTRKHRYENGGGQRRTFWSYVKQLRAEKYDTAFVLKRSFSSAALAFLAGIPERIGFNTEGRGFLLTKRVAYPKGVHEVEAFLDVLRAAKIPVTDTHLESWWSVSETQKADDFLASYEAFENVALHLTSSNVAKQWPKEQYEIFTRNWLAENPARHIHCLGASQDAALYENLRETLPPALRERVHIWCGQLNLLESMAFLRKMKRMVGVDSGTLHMASAAGIPVFALFGPMDETRWAPPEATVITEPVPCRPCSLSVACPHEFRCMTQLTAQKVLDEVLRV